MVQQKVSLSNNTSKLGFVLSLGEHASFDVIPDFKIT